MQRHQVNLQDIRTTYSLHYDLLFRCITDSNSPGAIDRRPMDDPLTPVHFSASKNWVSHDV